MKRFYTYFLALAALSLLTVAAAPSTLEKRSPTDTARTEGVRGGQLEQGGAELGQGYGQGGRELGRGAAGFGRNLARADFGAAGRSLGSGSAGFGKGVATGTARGFKHFGLAVRNVGEKIDRWASDEQ